VWGFDVKKILPGFLLDPKSEYAINKLGIILISFTARDRLIGN
jgi:hypothetical protein